MLRGLGPAVLVALLGLSTAHAAPLADTWAVAGDVRTAPGSTIEGTPLALYVPTAAGLQTLHLRAPLAYLHVYSRDLASVSAGGASVLAPIREQVSTYALHDLSAVLHVKEPANGWLGAYPLPDSTAALTAARAPTLAPAARERIGNEATTDEQPARPELPVYAREIREPHVRTLATGTLNLSGGFALKICGPDLDVAARENRTTLRTGGCGAPDAPAATHNRTWVTIEIPGSGDLSLGLVADAHLALDAATIEQPPGVLTFTRRDGEPVSLRGALRATLTPIPSGTGVVGLLHVSGDVEAMTLIPVNAPRADVAPRLPWIAATAVLALALAALLVARRPPRALTLARLRAAHGPDVAAGMWAAMTLHYMGDERRALALLRRALDRWPHLARDPTLTAAFRGHPDADALLADADLRASVGQ